MPFDTPATYTAFGKNEYARSSDIDAFEHYTTAADVVPKDASSNRVLQSGTVMARITSGHNLNKIGPRMAAGTNEVQTITKAGTWTSGTYTLSFGGQTTTAIATTANAATIQAALVLLSTVGAGNATVTGGSLDTTPVVVTFIDSLGATDVALLTVDTTGVVGGGTAAVVETTKGVFGATDGRQTDANIVGVCDTFLPFQLNYGDREVSVAKRARVVGATCYEYKAGTTASPGDRGLSAGTITALSTRGADLDLMVV